MKKPGKNSTRLVLVRHGETEWNVVERFRGRMDLELNEWGRRQAQAAAGRLSSWPVAAVYSSPLKRALHTAQPIAQACGQEVTVLEALSDVDYGAWTGLSPEEASAHNEGLFMTWAETPQLMQFPEGESLEQVRHRAWAALEEVAQAHRRQTVALVSHVVVNRVLICASLGVGSEGFWSIGQDNAAISILEAAGGQYRLLLLNDTCHLEALQESGDG